MITNLPWHELTGQLYRRTNEVHYGPQAQYPFYVGDCPRRVSSITFFFLTLVSLSIFDVCLVLRSTFSSIVLLLDLQSR